MRKTLKTNSKKVVSKTTTKTKPSVRKTSTTNRKASTVKLFPRERDLRTVFGPHSTSVSPEVVIYLRKNPRSVIESLTKIYGVEQLLRYVVGA